MTSPVLARHSTRLLNDRKQAESDFLLQQHGQLISNFKSMRLDMGFSLEQLAAKSYISKTAIVRAENGTYSNPMPSLVAFWVRYYASRGLALSDLEVEDAYLEFQHKKRRQAPAYFGPTLAVSTDVGAVHPFRQLRDRHVSYADGEVLPVGPDEVSRALCLPVDVLRYWEKKWRQQQSVPKLVREVLMFIGYGRNEVSAFCDQYAEWRFNNSRGGVTYG